MLCRQGCHRRSPKNDCRGCISYADLLFMRKFFPIWTQLILNVNYNICKHDILTFYNLVQESLPPNLHLLIIGKVLSEKHGVGIV